MANIINFNKDDEQKNAQGQDKLTQGSSGAASITPGAGGGQQQQQAPGTASSGKFTNIQKYIGANKGAGDQVAGGINKQQDKSLQAGRIAQSDEAKKVAAGVQQANTVLDRGQGYFNQINQDPNFRKFEPTVPGQAAPQPQQYTGDTVGIGQVTEQGPNPNIPVAPLVPQQQPGFNALDFVNDENRLTDFTNIKTGGGVDQIGLQTQATKAQDLAGQSKVQADELANRSKTEAGRFGLISQAFARPNYTQGQKRLDNLFLTGSGNKSIESVQNKGKQNLQQAQDVLKQSTDQFDTTKRIGETEADLQKRLQDRSSALESGLLSNLESFIPQVNQERDTERGRWQDNFNTLVGKGGQDSSIADDIWDQLQLQQGEHTLNVLNDPNLTLRSIANVSDRNAQGFQDVANKQDVKQYEALAKLAMGGIGSDGKFSFDPSQLKLTKESDLESAVKAKEGQDSLRSMLNNAQDNFLKYSQGANIYGEGSDKGTSSIFGGGSTANARMGINLADYLGANGMDAVNAQNTNQERANLGQVATDVSGMIARPGVAMGINALGNSDLGRIFGGLNGAPGQLAGSLINSLGLGGGAGSGAAANNKARLDLLNNLQSTLVGQGYNNYLTRKGNVNADMNMEQQKRIEIERLNSRNQNGYFTDPLNTKEQQDTKVQDDYIKQIISQANGGGDYSLYGGQNAVSGLKNDPTYLKQLENQVATAAMTSRDSRDRTFTNQNGQKAYYQELTPQQQQAEVQSYLDSMRQGKQDMVNSTVANRQATEDKWNTHRQGLLDGLNQLRGLPPEYKGK